MRAESDSMEFWRMWKGNRACGARMNVTPGACEAHFLALFRAESPAILQLDGDVRVEELDEQITENEVRIAIEGGKNGKAAGPDCLTNECMKDCLGVLLVAVLTALSVSVPSRDRCVRPPSHHRATWTLSPRCLVNSRPHESHL